MEIKKKIVPYEFLVRFNDLGELKGAHVGFMTVISEGDVILSRNIENVQPVAIGEVLGFPLAEILDVIQIEALKSVEEKALALTGANAQIQSLTAEKSALITEKESLIKSLAEKNTEISILKQKISDLEALNGTAKEEVAPLPLTKDEVK